MYGAPTIVRFVFVCLAALLIATSAPSQPAPQEAAGAESTVAQPSDEQDATEGAGSSPPSEDQLPSSASNQEQEQTSDAPDTPPNDDSDERYRWVVATSAVVQAFAAIAIAVFTLLLVRFNRRALSSTETAAEAARVTAGIAATALEQADRPWLVAQLSIDELILDGNGVAVFLHVDITNVGRSAAQYAQVIVDAIPSNRAGLEPGTEQKRAFNDKAILDRNPERHCILPGETLSASVVAMLRMDTLGEVWIANGYSEVPQERRPIQPLIFGCIRYTHGVSIQGPSISRQVHHTIFAKEIVMRLGNGPVTLGARRLRGEELTLNPSVYDFSYAD